MLRCLVILCVGIVALGILVGPLAPMARASSVPPGWGSAPWISDMSCTAVGGIAGAYTISGHVVNNPPPGTQVTISGIAGNYVVNVNPDGSFSCALFVGAGVTGTVTGQASTPGGQTSNSISDLLL
jgi:hypothetical protein